MRECRRHTVIFETPRRIHPFVLHEQAPLFHTNTIGHSVSALQDGLAFANGQNFIAIGKRKQFSETPHTTEGNRIGPLRPFGLEFAQASGRG
jgi:hypothetical protein